MGRELNGGEVMYVAMGVPVAQGWFSGDRAVVLKLFELGTAIVFTMWYADGGGAHIVVAMLMVTPLRCDGVEVEFDVNRVGGEKVVVVVSVREHLEVPQALSPLLGSLCRRRVAKQEGDVNEADSKNGFRAFDVLAVVNECRKGSV